MSQSKRKEYIDSLEERKYLVSEAMEFLQSAPKVKFNESIDIAINLGIDPSKSDQNMRGATILPAGSGKPCKVAVFVEGDQANDAKEAGADAVGMEDLAEDLKKGEIEFDVVIATPDTMKIVSPLGKVLGPKGLMPNPKLGSVTEDLKKAISDAKSGQAEIRNDKDGNIGVSIGKKSFHDDQLLKNFHAILDALEKEKSNNTLKGDLIKNTFVTSSMGVSYKVKLGKSI